jgi:23S rRNA pseudouridine1911/1915/1917 synthase
MGGGNTDYVVSKEYDGVVLRTFLKNGISLSRALVSSLKREQGIRVNGEKVTVRYVLKENDVVSVDFEDKEKTEKILPVFIPLCIVYEDEDIVVVDKPPFMPVHPSYGHYMDTLANALQYKYRDQNFVMRAVNRLDRNTSGLVLVAKNRRAASILSTQMKNREIGKKYYALVEGVPPDEFSLEAFMRRREESLIERCICPSSDNGAEFSSTEGRRLHISEFIFDEKQEEMNCSLLELIPHTGRTHQLRVHLAYLGFPIVGDELYGTKEENLSDNGTEVRHMLHCCFLEFVHPSENKKMKFYSNKVATI